ncbi:Membrane-bound protein lytR [Slackia heliotrinireducens]|uniref:Transcriptional regulator n=1 Tax=Slackia heliotrinireducens (strain ATCC 29202 / DSM 20476 / NCTC 11029 / RHS 1) TaxID=471855 RepID=C7N5W7_SLAHD|nr:transcriptional regulator [Slackia heliotrinireducens DSM 20476]VEH00508.1 Membrane-bound protein lytR [Slackia heliotrinireducens]
MTKADEDGMVVIRTRKRKRKGRRSKKRGMARKTKIALIIIGVLALLLAIAVGTLVYMLNSGESKMHGEFTGIVHAPETVVTQNDGKTIEYNGHTYEYNENVVSVLVMGLSDESMYDGNPDAHCADAVILVAMDTETNEMKLIVVPRNSVAEVDMYEGSKLVETRPLPLTLAYPTVVGGTEDEAAANVARSVSRLMYNMPINYYLGIEQDAFVGSVDALGGVTVTALQTIPGTNYVEGEECLLIGEDALKYVKWRDTSVAESALDRQERQMQFVKAFASKARNSSVTELVGLYNDLSADMVTNLGASEVAYMASCLISGENASLDMVSLTGTTEKTDELGKPLEFYYLDEDSVTEAVLAAFYTQID